MTAAKKLKNDLFTGLKHGNWYLVEDDKDLVGESTNGGIFSGSKRENEKIFG